MANVNIVLAPRAGGMSDMPVPAAVYVYQEKAAITVAANSTLTCPSDRTDLFWFVTPETAAVRLLERVAGAGSDVAITTGWFVPAGARWEAKATPGSTLSLILG